VKEEIRKEGRRKRRNKGKKDRRKGGINIRCFVWSTITTAIFLASCAIMKKKFYSIIFLY
jgi:hypothetical protein